MMQTMTAFLPLQEQKIGRHATMVQLLLLLVSDCFNTRSCPQIHLSSLSCLQNSADTTQTIPLWSCCVISENSNLTLHWGQSGSELNLNLTAPCARATILLTAAAHLLMLKLCYRYRQYLSNTKVHMSTILHPWNPPFTESLQPILPQWQYLPDSNAALRGTEAKTTFSTSFQNSRI